MRKNLMNLRLFDGDPAGTDGNGSQNAGKDGQKSSGTFTYEQLDEIATSRADRASKAALKSYFQQQGLSEEEAAAAINQYKRDKASRTPDISAIEKERDEARQELADLKNTGILRDKGVRAEDLDYVSFKVKAMVDEKTDFSKAAEKFLKDNPRFTANGYKVSSGSTGSGDNHTGAGNGSINDAIRRFARR